MSDKRWEQIGAAGGILFVLLQLSGQALIQIGGSEPDFTAPAGEIVAFFMNRDPQLFAVGGILSAFSAIAILWFLGVLWAALRRHETAPAWMSHVAFGSGLVAVAVTLGGDGWGLVMLRLDAGMDPEIVRLLFDQGNLTFATFWIPLASLVLASGIVAIRAGALPRWLGWFSLIAALALLIGRIFWTLSSMVVFVPYMLFWLWLIITSVVLIRRAGKGAM